jgi:prepilin-type N-terminal cleavage/methylation domain-containing protein
MKHMTMKLKPTACGHQGGFSLVELMVALVIGLLILAGLLVAFSGNRATYRLNDQMMQIQEVGRFAMDTIREDLRMASYAGGCTNVGLDIGIDVTGDPNPVKTRYSAILAKFGYDLDNPPTNADELEKMGVAQNLIVGISGNDTTLKIHGVPMDSYGLISYCDKSGDVSDATTYIIKPGDVHMKSSPNENEPDLSSPLQPFNATRDTWARVGWSQYEYNATDKTITVTTALEAATSLLENVEAFGFCVAEDRNVDGELDSAFAPPTAASWQGAVAVQVSFVVSSREDVLETAAPVSFTYCGNGNSATTVSFNDKKLHRQFTSVTMLRNKMANGYGKDISDTCYKDWLVDSSGC